MYYLDFSESLVLIINQVYSSAHLKFHLVGAISCENRVPTIKFDQNVNSFQDNRVTTLGSRKLHFPQKCLRWGLYSATK